MNDKYKITIIIEVPKEEQEYFTMQLDNIYEDFVGVKIPDTKLFVTSMTTELLESGMK